MASLAIPQSLVQRFTDSIFKISRERPILFILSLAGVFSSVSWMVYDYRSFKSIGKGGVPYNVFGWLAVTLLRPISRSQKSLTNTSDLDRLVKQIANEEGEKAVFKRLTLSQRRGERPTVRGIIPQRQVDKFGSPELTGNLNKFVSYLSSTYPTILRIAPSAWEGHNDALFLVREHPASLKSDLLSERVLAKAYSRLEILHVHPSDGSLHASLSPADASEVIRQGWGTFHTLSGRYKDLPVTYVMLYAPRDNEEVQVVKKIIAAAVEYASGLDVTE
ncbi:hypothetical protein Clacol_002092 [Clathrus columnatus]|uniref:Luciferase domain-containing protein n=1 Tax=Clathrus columnatus TaxID=1419009 RepID=A0AAV5A4C3_9AGAM|nr:hypothetical protein Clacol_002092 [Clathrus columnatus]